MADVSKILAKLEKTHENWRKTLLEMFKEGASDREVCCALQLSKGAWDTLMAAQLECDFAELVDMGRLVSQAWWETQGRKNLHNGKFQYGGWTIQMKNRFGWSEKSESSMTQLDLNSLDDAALSREIKLLLKANDTGRAKTTL